MSFDEKWGGKRLQNALGDFNGVAVFFEFGQEDHEFIAREPGDGIFDAAAFFQAGGEFLQQNVMIHFILMHH